MHHGATARVNAWGVGVLLSATLLCAAWAGEEEEKSGADLMEMSLEDLMNVEVTSVSRKKEKRQEAAAAIFVISQEDIRRSGATTVADVLRIVPGLNVARLDASKWAITSRGFNGRFANKLLVLLDGRTVYAPLFAGVYWHALDTLLADIDRIEIIRGPGATMWGANAVNGVINIMTKNARDTHGGLASVIAGTEDKIVSGLRYGGAFSDDAHYRLHLKFFDRDDGALASGAPGSDDWRAWRGGLRVDWDLGPDDNLTVWGDAFDCQDGQTLITHTLWPPYSYPHDDYGDTKGGDLQARLWHRFSDGGDLALQMYYDRFDRTSLASGEIRDTFDIDIQHRFEAGARHEIVWGGGFRYTKNHPYNTPSVILDPEGRRDRLFSAFIQDRISFAADHLRLVVGSKFEYNDYTGFEVQPSVRLTWLPNDRHTLWASVSRAVRTVSRVESDMRLNSSTFPFGQMSLFGTADLGSEDMLACELGYRFTPGEHISIDIATFYNWYEDLRTVEVGLPFLELWPLPPHIVIPGYADYTMDAETCGVELAVEWQPLAWWRLRGTYAFLNVDHRLNPRIMDLLSRPLRSDSPRHQAGLESHIDLPGNVEIDATFRYVGAIDDSVVMDDYFNLDLRLGWHPSKNLEIALVGQNLLEKQHPEFTAAFIDSVPTQVERGIYGKVTWQF